MCLIKHHEMKMNGKVEVLFLTVAVDGDDGELHAPAALYLEKQPPVPIVQDTWWAPRGKRTVFLQSIAVQA
jgi:hypothetical protein